jgi:hypothetical protein
MQALHGAANFAKHAPLGAAKFAKLRRGARRNLPARRFCLLQ